MADDRYAVPDWLNDYAALWIERLHLTGWKINLKIEHCINDDVCIEALTTQRPQLNEATISFRSDVEDTENWRITVIHELLHVLHARIDRFLEFAVFPEMLSDEGRRIVREGYSQHYESFTHGLAVVLYRMWEVKSESNGGNGKKAKNLWQSDCDSSRIGRT